jgi:hypothetical protein
LQTEAPVFQRRLAIRFRLKFVFSPQYPAHLLQSQPEDVASVVLKAAETADPVEARDLILIIIEVQADSLAWDFVGAPTRAPKGGLTQLSPVSRYSRKLVVAEPEWTHAHTWYQATVNLLLTFFEAHQRLPFAFCVRKGS